MPNTQHIALTELLQFDLQQLLSAYRLQLQPLENTYPGLKAKIQDVLEKCHSLMTLDSNENLSFSLPYLLSFTTRLSNIAEFEEFKEEHREYNDTSLYLAAFVLASNLELDHFSTKNGYGFDMKELFAEEIIRLSEMMFLFLIEKDVKLISMLTDSNRHTTACIIFQYYKIDETLLENNPYLQEAVIVLNEARFNIADEYPILDDNAELQATLIALHEAGLNIADEYPTLRETTERNNADLQAALIALNEAGFNIAESCLTLISLKEAGLDFNKVCQTLHMNPIMQTPLAALKRAGLQIDESYLTLCDNAELQAVLIELIEAGFNIADEYPTLCDNAELQAVLIELIEAGFNIADEYPTLRDNAELQATLIALNEAGLNIADEYPTLRNNAKLQAALIALNEAGLNIAEEYPTLRDNAELQAVLIELNEVEFNIAEEYPTLRDNAELQAALIALKEAGVNIAEEYPTLRDNTELQAALIALKEAGVNIAEEYPTLRDNPNLQTALAAAYNYLQSGCFNWYDKHGKHGKEKTNNFIDEITDTDKSLASIQQSMKAWLPPLPYSLAPNFMVGGCGNNSRLEYVYNSGIFNSPSKKITNHTHNFVDLTQDQRVEELTRIHRQT